MSGISLETRLFTDAFDGPAVFACGELLFFPSLCASQRRLAHVFSLFPGQRSHALYIDVIMFMTDGPRSPSLSHGARREKER